MKNVQALSDKTAMGLSIICALHCLLVPIAIILVPAVAALPIADEDFHQWMVLFVLPISLFALNIGYKQHQHFRVYSVTGMGLIILVLAALFGHDLLGHLGETLITLLGVSLVATGHYLNYHYSLKTPQTCSMN